MILKDQKRINDYDYKKMMKNFESETRHKKFLNSIKNKWRAASCRYKEKVALIKIKNEKINRMRDKEFKRRFLQKENAIKNQLELKNMEKLEEKKRMALLLQKKNEEQSKNLEKFRQMQEEERLKLEEETFQRSKYLYLFILNI